MRSSSPCSWTGTARPSARPRATAIVPERGSAVKGFAALGLANPTQRANDDGPHGQRWIFIQRQPAVVVRSPPGGAVGLATLLKPCAFRRARPLTALQRCGTIGHRWAVRARNRQRDRRNTTGSIES